MAKTASTPQPVETDFTPALDAAQNQLGLTFSASDSLDTKALAMLGFVVALFIFALQSEMHNSLWLLGPMFLMFGATAVLAILTIWPRKYVGSMVSLERHPEYLRFTKDQLVLQLLADTQEAIDTNNDANALKSAYSIISLITSLTGVGFLIGCIL